MPDNELFSEFIPAGKQPVPPPVPTEAPAAPEGFSEFIPAKPPDVSQGFLNRLDTPPSHIPRDIVDMFMEGLHSTLRAPGQATGFGESSYADLGPKIEQQLKAAGYTDEQAKMMAARSLRSITSQEGRTALLQGPMQMLFSPALGIYRSMVSRPAEQITGIPKEAFEAAGLIGSAVHGLHKFSRVTVDQNGKVNSKPVGEPPIDVDFENATKLLTKEKPPIIEGEYTVVGEEPRLAAPQKALPAPETPTPKTAGTDLAMVPPKVVEANLRRLWEEDGIHPAEVVQDIGSDPFLREQLTQPIEAYHGTPHEFEAFDISKVGTGEGAQAYGHGIYFAESEAVARSYQETLGGRVDASVTDPAMIAASVVQRSGRDAAIRYFERQIERGRDIETSQKAKDLIEQGAPLPEIKGGNLYRVRIHANKEQFLDWDKPLSEQPANVQDFLISHGADPGITSLYGEQLMRQLADKLGGQEAASAAMREAGIPGIKYLDQGSRRTSEAIQSDIAAAKAELRGMSPDTSVGKMLSDNITALESEFKANTGGGTSNFVVFDDAAIEITHKNGEQIIREVDAGRGEPPRSANLSPDGLPRWIYPQVAQQLAAGQTPGQPPAAGGGAQPPRVPPTGLGPAQQPAGGGMPPPPPQGPPLAPAPPQRPPFFTYDDRNAWAKAFSNFVDTWVRTFQPELKGSMRSDLALQADPAFAKYKASSQNLKDQIIHNQEADYQYWRGQSEADRLRYLKGFESGNVPAPWQARADVHKQIMDYASKLELQYGSKADYFENYFPHIFQDPLQARNYVEGRTAQMGPNWFQKERTFKSIKDAMDAGLRLVNTNPEYLISHRLASTVDMLERMDLLDHLKELGGAVPVAEARAERAQRITIAQQLGLPIDVTTIGRDLSAEGWITVNAPGSTSGRGLASAGAKPDDRAWFISPDIQPLWQNVMDAKGLWGNEGNLGSIFRGYMAVKNVYVPIKLALSAFHPLHVMHINMMAHVRQAVIEAAKGNYGDALREYGDIIYDPVAAIPGVPLPHEGKFAREAWLIPEDARTPTQQLVVQTMKEGGLVANLSEELRAGSKRAFEDALDKHQWFQFAPQLLREGVRRLSAPIFEEWIPNLKVAAYLRDAGNFAQQHPGIWADDVQRTVALRTIAKSTENRYGEMFYGGMFWNRTLKDVGVGGLISLGWQTGFLREYLGGVVSPFARGARALARPATPTEETIYKAQTKTSYAFTYMAGSMIMAGIATIAGTGEDPEGMDWFLPRTGRTNPDGTPHRLTHMSYSREAPMLEKHIQASGSIIGGIADTMQSKLVFNPLIELVRNKDYYGNEIWSERSPLYQRGAQMANHIFAEQIMPISGKGAQQAMRTGGGWDEAALALLGFGPAPSYANKTPLQNMIGHLFQKYVAPEMRPQEMGARTKERGDIGSEILQAQQRGDTATVTAGAQKWFKAGGSRQGLSNILLHIPPDVSQFRALPEVIQGQVMDAASPAEKMRYRPYLKSDVAARVADLQVEALAASGAGDQAGAQKIANDIQGIMSEAVHSGKITNLGEFQRSVMRNMQFRLQPQAAAEKADVGRQKKIQRIESLQPAMQ